MGITSRINNKESLQEKMFREERAYRADKLVEKWAKVAEVGKGITEMETNTARNLAILLENQTRSMARMTEAQLSTSFMGQTPENLLRLIRLSYPNSVRGMLFTEFAMETAHDSIRYIEPHYTNAQRQDFDWENDPNRNWNMDNRFDDPAHNHDIMYESQESRYVTELINSENILKDSDKVSVTFEGGAFDLGYIDGYSCFYVVVDKKRLALAMQGPDGSWFGGKDVLVGKSGQDGVYLKVASWVAIDKGYKFAIEKKVGATGDYSPCTDLSAYTFAATGRFDSEKDLTGKYLGEVELEMRDYHFKPRPIAIGVTWTQLTELVLDTSFGVSAEEVLLDSASQEIKKSLDYQSIKFGVDNQRARASEHFVKFDAEAGGTTKDSYYHTAQLIGQAIDRIGDLMLNEIGRGGVSAIVGGPAACNYLKLNKLFSDKGKQPAIGGHKVGELDGITIVKVPSGLIADDELLTTWKNENADGDVSIAIGTLLPFYSTGSLVRKNFYREAGISRYEDMKCLNPNYLGRIQIQNIREVK